MLNYTVIENVRHQFGKKDVNIGVFAGTEEDFSFDCPGVDPSETALLLFQSSGTTREQTLEINGSTVFGGVPTGPISVPLELGDRVVTFGWSGNIMLVSPGTLKENGNVMRVTAVADGDRFLIDNVVIMYRVEPGSAGLSAPDPVEATRG